MLNQYMQCKNNRGKILDGSKITDNVKRAGKGLGKSTIQEGESHTQNKNSRRVDFKLQIVYDNKSSVCESYMQ